MGIQINGQTDTISATDGSLNLGGTVTVNVTGDATGLSGTPNINVGVLTAASAVISGNLQVDGTTTTLDTLLTEVDKLEVGANNTTVGVAITQSGTGDILNLYDGSTEVFTVTDGGNVGIGTDNPQGKLVVSNGSAGLEFNPNSGQAIVSYNRITSAYTPIGLQGSTVGLYIGGVGEALRISNTGNIGIGTTNPDIYGYGGKLLTVSDSSTYTNLILASSDTTNSGISFGGQTLRRAQIQGGNGSDSDLRFLTNSSNSGIFVTEKVRITSSGNVGIGTNNPPGQLTLYQTNNDVYASTIRNYEFLSIQNKSTTSGSRVGFELQVDGVGNASVANISAIDAGGGYTDLAIGLRNSDVYQEKLRITSNGKVGIGSETPTEMLDVTGSGDMKMVVQTKSSGAGTNAGIRIATGDGYKWLLQVGDSTTSGGLRIYQETSGSAGERLRITSAGTLESYSPDDTTPNIKWRSNDTNWYGSLNQSVEGGTITSFLSCGGDWSADGTTYSATKALAAYPTSAIAVHNQYNSTWGSEFVFLTKAGGSTTTDGAVTERLRINSSGLVGIGTAAPRDKVDVRGGSYCMTGDGSNFRPHIVVRPSSGTTTIKYFEYYFDTIKSVNSPSAQDRYILDIVNMSTFFHASFEVVYGTRLQGVSDAVVSTCTKTFGVNRFNSGNVAVTDENSISVDSNSNTHADVTMDALSSSGVRLKVAFSSTLGGSSFCSGVVRGWGVYDVFREPGSGGANELIFYNGM